MTSERRKKLTGMIGGEIAGQFPVATKMLLVDVYRLAKTKQCCLLQIDKQGVPGSSK